MVSLYRLLPGEEHRFRVLAGNIAGVIAPSDHVTHTPRKTGGFQQIEKVDT